MNKKVKKVTKAMEEQQPIVKMKYQAPVIKKLDVKVEKGYATSAGVSVSSWENGSW